MKVENLVTVDSFYNAIIGKVVKIGAFIKKNRHIVCRFISTVVESEIQHAVFSVTKPAN